MYRKLAIAVVVLLAFGSMALLQTTHAQSTVWEDVAGRAVPETGQRMIVPTEFRLVRVDMTQLSVTLAAAPMADSRGEGVVLTLPLPDGDFGRFQIINAPIMEPELAARYPELQTYTAQGIDDPTATGRLDLTPHGFHAFIQSANGTIFIDPYQTNDITHYISYEKSAYVKPFRSFVELMPSMPPAPRNATEVANLSTGDVKRTYQIALSSSGEYADFICTQGGDCSTPAAKRATALAAIVTGMNRVTQIYERDITVSFVLVNDNDQLVFTDKDTDPYTDGSNADAIDSDLPDAIGGVLALEDYDLGHGIGSGGSGGLAGPFDCEGAMHKNKATGATSFGAPIGDPFWVDYVAHEIGHQFYADHSYNASMGGACTTRVAETAYEPGSGTTIMSYAGICGSQDVQARADAMFNAGAIEQMVEFITIGEGATCADETPTGNTAPTVEAGISYTIPIETPFLLTAEVSDAEQATNAITTSWEQFTLGAAWVEEKFLPNTDEEDDEIRPIFRVFAPSSSPTRSFPVVENIIDDFYFNDGEDLPSIAQILTFRATARDNGAGGGGVSSDDMQVTVADNAGPFYVTSQDSEASFDSGDSATVTWDVANTTAAPVNCANVDIALSLNGANTFPNALATGTPNDGSEVITIPNVDTTEGYIRVKCSDNIFFDINKAPLTITGLPTAVDLQHSTSSTTAISLVVVAFVGLLLVTVRRWMVSERHNA